VLRRHAAVQRVDQRRVLLGDEVAADLARAGELVVVRIELLVQHQEAVHLRVGEHRVCSELGVYLLHALPDELVHLTLAGQVGIAGHLKVGDDAVLTAKSATSHDVEPGKTISGIPGIDNREWLRSTAAFRRLGEMSKKLRELSDKIAKFEEKK